jgi:hypothetical protein
MRRAESSLARLVADRSPVVRRALGIVALIVALVVAASFSADTAHAQIKQPGAHSRYSVELEPHLAVHWTNDTWWNDDGIGVGFRASIPVIDNGPVTTINNNFAVSFGLDWAHFGDCGPYDACGADEFWLPIAAQWNFFFSDVVSLFPELGLALRHSRLEWGRVTPNCNNVNGLDICDDTNTSLELVLWLGARFTLADDFALTLRLGTPSVLFGAAFLL